jgi:hypothetical protein
MVEITYMTGVERRVERVHRDDLHAWLQAHSSDFLLSSRPVKDA